MQSMARGKPLIPEVIEPDEKLPPDLVALRRLSILLDEAIAIPGTKRRVGLDAGLGLIPGIGDIVAGVMSAWIIAGAVRHRVPLPKIFRMIFNVLLDIVFGSIPLLGDVFDFAFEENVMNMRILMQYRNRRLPPRSPVEIGAAFTLIVIVIVGFALLAAVGVVAAIIWAASRRNF